jgi:hypothetical protein
MDVDVDVQQQCGANQLLLSWRSLDKQAVSDMATVTGRLEGQHLQLAFCFQVDDTISGELLPCTAECTAQQQQQQQQV